MKIEEQEFNVESVIKNSEQKIYKILCENQQICRKSQDNKEVQNNVVKEVLEENSLLKKMAEQNGIKTITRFEQESKFQDKPSKIPRQQKTKGVLASQELIFNDINK